MIIQEKQQDRIVALLQEIFPDALEIKSSMEPTLVTVNMPNYVRIAISLSLRCGGSPNGWVVYDGLSGGDTVLVNTSLGLDNWDDIVGFVSLARNIYNKAAEATIKFREVLEGLQFSTC